MQNFNAQIFTDIKKYDHISPALKELGCRLYVESMLLLDNVTMVAICMNDLAPRY